MICCKKLTNVVANVTGFCVNAVFISCNMISFKVIISVLEIPIYYGLTSDAYSHFSVISMSDNQIVEKGSETICQTFPTVVVSRTFLER